jgi:CO/xanthine dehydrogenase Mo-binding subunit
VANGFWFNGGHTSSLHAAINPDGTVSLIEGNTDIGGTRASIAMQLAETLGIPFEAVKPTVVDTDTVGHNGVTGGSRVTFASGWAAYECGLDLRRQLIGRAAKIWEVPPDQVVYEDGALCCTTDETKRLTFKEIAGKLNATGAPVVARATVAPAGVGGAFCTVIVDVEVDPETGKVDILRATAVQDAGTAIHPSYVEGQMQGGVAQGIGWALNEEYVYGAEGQLLNASYLDYRMPTALDLPMIETVIVEVPNPGHPYGVRGVGEVPLVAPLAAVANALYRATGKRFRDLPINPARIVQELHEIG